VSGGGLLGWRGGIGDLHTGACTLFREGRSGGEEDVETSQPGVGIRRGTYPLG